MWHLANALIHLHRYQQAHHLLTDVLETLTSEVFQAHQATIAELYAQRGVILSHLYFPRRAVLDLNQVFRLHPETGRLYHVRGLLHMQQHAWTAAYHTQRHVTILQGHFCLQLSVRRCHQQSCPRYHQPYRPEDDLDVGRGHARDKVRQVLSDVGQPGRQLVGRQPGHIFAER